MVVWPAILRRRTRYIVIGCAVLGVVFLVATRREFDRRVVHSNFAESEGYSDTTYLPDAYDNKQEVEMSGGSLRSPPPTYEKMIEQERALPQHNIDLPYPEGRNGLYLKFSSQIQGLGWNNVFNEVLLCSHLAWRTKRAYVFQDYVWKVEYYPWRVPKWPWPRTPLSALISGPTAGGPWAEGDNTPRSVREEWWDKVCTPEDTDILDTDVVKPAILWNNAQEIMDHWAKLITDSPKRCVEVVSGSSGKDDFPQVFDLRVVSEARALSVWDEFSSSPVSKLLRPSLLVQSAIKRNEHLFRPPRGGASSIYDRMMAVHIRRGDYEDACKDLARWNSTFYGWNLLPIHPDKFAALPGGGWGWTTPENEELYKTRCYPTDQQLLAKIRSSKDEWEKESVRQGKRIQLDIIYVMTNAKKDWVDGFEKKLRGNGWKIVVTSQDLIMDDEQFGVNMAVDMDLGRRAAVFIGNGWSSMTSNVIHQRLVDGKQRLDNRFW